MPKREPTSAEYWRCRCSGILNDVSPPVKIVSALDQRFRWPVFIAPEPKPKSEPRKQSWQIQTEQLLRDHADVLGWRGKRFDAALREREVSFLKNMASSRTCPSQSQEKWLNDVAARIRRAA